MNTTTALTPLDRAAQAAHGILSRANVLAYLDMPEETAELVARAVMAAIPKRQAVTRAETIAFIEHACRNWHRLRVNNDEVEDMRAALERFAADALTNASPAPAMTTTGLAAAFDAFDKAAQGWGYEASDGYDPATTAKIMARYFAAKIALGAAVAQAIESAYRDGHCDGATSRGIVDADDDWRQSDTIAALAGVPR